MSKEHIMALLDKISQLGMYFKKVRIEQYNKQGELRQIVEHHARISVYENFVDRHGIPDDEAAKRLSDAEFHDTLLKLYEHVKTELFTRPKYEGDVLHRYEEKDLLEFKSRYQLFGYCLRMLRILKIDTPHDVMFMQPVQDLDNRNIGMRAIPEKVVTSGALEKEDNKPGGF